MAYKNGVEKLSTFKDNSDYGDQDMQYDTAYAEQFEESDPLAEMDD